MFASNRDRTDVRPGGLVLGGRATSLLVPVDKSTVIGLWSRHGSRCEFGWGVSDAHHDSDGLMLWI